MRLLTSNHSDSPAATAITYSCDRVLSDRNRLRDTLVTEMLDEKLDLECLAQLIDTTRRVLGKGILASVVETSVSSSVGDILSRDVIYEIAWRLAGNRYRLLRRRPATPWTRQRHPEWVPAQVVSAKRQRNYGKTGHEFVFRIIAGTAAGWCSRVFWGDRFVQRLSRLIGFKPLPRGKARKPATLLFRHPVEIVNLRMLVLLDPELSQDGDPGFRFAKEGGALNRFNVMRLNFRERNGFECARGYAKNVSCYKCSAGIESCAAAVRPRDMVMRHCASCKQEAISDLDVSLSLCINCFNKRAVSSDG